MTGEQIICMTPSTGTVDQAILSFLYILIHWKFATYVLPYIPEQYIMWGKNNKQYNVCMLEWSTQWQPLYVIEAIFDNLDVIIFIWFFLFSDSSIETPRNMVTWTLLNYW